jgi:hypothetical protein
VIRGLGYRRTADGAAFERKPGGRRPEPAGRKDRRTGTDVAGARREQSDDLRDSPFARLADLRLPS